MMAAVLRGHALGPVIAAALLVGCADLLGIEHVPAGHGAGGGDGGSTTGDGGAGGSVAECMEKESVCEGAARVRVCEGGLWVAQDCPAAKPLCRDDRCVGVAQLGRGVAIDVSCVLLDDGSVWCWGTNDWGQQALPLRTQSTATPHLVTGAGTATRLFSANHSVCALASDGTARCWGRNDFGRLGTGSSVPREVTEPSTIQATNIAELAMGFRHACALSTSGTVRCWGDNAQGELGIGEVGGGSLEPAAAVALPGEVASLRAGSDHTCALLTDETLWCWGRNEDAQLGYFGPSSPVPVKAPIDQVMAVAPGNLHNCALRTDGSVWCWGNNDLRQCGPYTGADYATPNRVEPLPPAVEVTAGFRTSCMREASGATWCWGVNDKGQVGNGSAGLPVYPPVQVARLEAQALATFWAHTCATTSEGLVCWGTNGLGQLGDGTEISRPLPTPVLWPTDG